MTPEEMKEFPGISDATKERFEKLSMAAEGDMLGLAVARHKRTGEIHHLLIVAFKEDGGETVIIRALGRLFDSDYDATEHYDLPGKPEVVELGDEE